MAPKTGRFAIVEQLLADGITYMFGNPGTVEQGFLDALGEYPDMRYITTLQETIAVAMGDGYARATQKPTVVQLHSGVGLGNGIGMMYQAKRGNAPLVVIAGESGVRYDSMDAQMAADLVSMARPVTKWSTRVVDPDLDARVLRRAIKMAATPPCGPVFVALPMDVLDAELTEDVVPTSFPDTRVAPTAEAVRSAVAMLAGASKPIVITGDGIAWSGAQAELTRVAELLGAEVWGANFSEVNIAADHPLFRGQLGHMFGDHSREITSQADARAAASSRASGSPSRSTASAAAQRSAWQVPSPAGARRLGAFQQQNRGIAAHPAAVRAAHRQRIQHEPVLPGDAGSHPAGHQQGKSRAGIQQLRQQRRGARQQVLQVVQHQQHPPRPQARQQRLSRVPPGFLADSQGVRERGRQGRRLGQAGQRHPGHPIGVQPVGLRLKPRDIHHQPGLPDSARAEHRDQPDPGPGQQGPDPADVVSHARPGRCAVPAPRLPAAAAPAAVRGRASTSRCARCSCSPGSAPSSSRSTARTRW